MILLLGKEGLFHVVGKDIQNVFQNLFKQRGKWRREVKKYVTKYYTPDAPHAPNKQKTIICMIDGRMHHGGLGDRLRGIVSVYSVCKIMHLNFKILFDSPFRLDTFFRPAGDLNWKIEREQLCYNSSESFPVFCGSNGTHVERPFQRMWFVKNFKKNAKQIHVYTNAILNTPQTFSQLFNELFLPTDILQKSIDAVLREIGQSYIAITCRFQQLLGDFKEGHYKVLDQSERQKLMADAAKEIEKIYNKQRDQLPILLTSDSVTFLAYMKEKAPYIHTIPGKLVHMDFSNDADIALHLKSFTDLMALSHAEKIFLLKSPEMYNSGFPRIAARIGGKPFKLIRFNY